MSNKVDHRVRYTKFVIKESFINLLEVKDISKITIKEICQHAKINRATFYNHYKDPYDLMKQIQEELLENVASYLDLEHAKDISQVSFTNIERIFEYIKENARICKILLGEGGDLNFQKQVFQLVYEKNLIDLTKFASLGKDDADYIYSFVLTGAVGIIQKWLDEDLRKSPAKMTELILKLTTQFAYSS